MSRAKNPKYPVLLVSGTLMYLYSKFTPKDVKCLRIHALIRDRKWIWDESQTVASASRPSQPTNQPTPGRPWGQFYEWQTLTVYCTLSYPVVPVVQVCQDTRKWLLDMFLLPAWSGNWLDLPQINLCVLITTCSDCFDYLTLHLPGPRTLLRVPRIWPICLHGIPTVVPQFYNMPSEWS